MNLVSRFFRIVFFTALCFILFGCPKAGDGIYILTVESDPAEAGVITVIPEQEFYAEGETVTIIAMEESGYLFSGWSGDLEGVVNPMETVITADTSVTALFDSAAEPDINIRQEAADIPSGVGSYFIYGGHVDGAGGYVSAETTFTIENTGNAVLNIGSVEIAAGDKADFDLTDSTASTVNPGSETTFSLQFDPLTTGDKSAVVSVISDDPDEALYTFTVSGAARTGTAAYVNQVDHDYLNHVNSPAVSPDGKNMYVAAGNSVSWLSRDVITGELTYINYYESFLDIEGAKFPTVSPDGKHVYITKTYGVAWLSRDSGTGALTYGGNYYEGSLIWASDVVISPDGLHGYAATHGIVVWFTRDSTTGALSYVGQYANSNVNGAMGLVFSPAGDQLYAGCSVGAVAWFDRDSSTGALTYAGKYDGDGLADVHGIAMSPDGKTVYVTDYESDGVAWLTRDSLTGSLSFGDIYTDTIILDGAWGVAVSPSGGHVYVIGQLANTAAWFARDAVSGALSYGGKYTHIDLGTPQGIVLSPDGKNAYLACYGAGKLALFDLD